MEWQDISSAPKNGTSILVWREGRQYVARWVESYQTWGVSVERIPGEEGPFTDIGDIGFAGHLAAHAPTHWMPLPPAPEGGE